MQFYCTINKLANPFSAVADDCVFVPLGKELARQLEGWLSAADLSHGPARAIIAP